MNPTLRDRILRRLDTLSDERGYQVLDYVEFLETKYAEKPPSPVSLLQRFTEGVEDRLRTGGVSASTVVETMGLLNRAVGVLGGVAAAGMSVASDVATAATDVAAGVQRSFTPPAGAAKPGGPGGAASAAAPASPAADAAPQPASVPGTPPSGGTGFGPGTGHGA